MTTNKHTKLKKEVQHFLSQESSGHDYHHAVRVYNNAHTLQSQEGGDLEIIGAAALVHDICRPWEKKTGKLHFGPEALEIIKNVLIKANISANKIESVLEVVAYHDIYDWSEKIEKKSIELQIVQDADNLDAIGAMGIARTFAFGGAYGLSLYNPGENLDFDTDFVENPNNRKSSIAHFYEKLLRLKENMNTKTGRKLAKKRHDFMENFLTQFFNEWNN